MFTKASLAIEVTHMYKKFTCYIIINQTNKKNNEFFMVIFWNVCTLRKDKKIKSLFFCKLLTQYK